MALADLKAVTEAFKSFGGVDLAASLSALQLLAQNSGCLARLEQAAVVAASLSSEGSNVSASQLSSILNDPPCSTSLAEDDPYFDDVLTEPIAFPGGLFLVSPGLGRDAVYVAEHLVESLFIHTDGVEGFIADISPTCLAALRVSDCVLRRAGLRRYELPQGSPPAPVVVDGDLDARKKAVQFSNEQLEAFLAPHSSASDLEPLVVELGSIELYEGGRLQGAPIVRHDNGYVVALPLALLDAVRHFIVTSAVSAGVIDEVSKRFRRAVEKDVDRSLSRLRMERLDLGLPDCGEDLPQVEALFRCDQDKIVYVQVVTDDLRDYDTGSPYGEWEVRAGLDISLDARRRRIERSLRNQGFDDSVMHLFISQQIGRERQIEFGGAIGSEPSGPHLALSAADLRTISAHEGRDSLLLYKYAAHREANMPSGHPLGRIDQLGTFALYRESGYSLRFDYDGVDRDRPFEFLGAGLSPREQTKREADVHLALYEKGIGVKVRRTELEADTEPIYIADPPPDMSLPLLVEGRQHPIWIHQCEASSAAEAEEDGAFQHMVAFWFWQLTDDLDPLLPTPRGPAAPVHIWLDLSTRPAWQANRPGDPRERSSAEIGADQSINVEIKAGDWELLAQADNVGEKSVMRLILTALLEVVHGAGAPSAYTLAKLDAILERGFANPRKKHLLILSANNVELSPGDLPPYRPVQEADRNEVRQRLGAHLQRELELGIGEIAAERRSEVLGTARDWALGEVQRQIAELEPTDLLERLLALNDAVVRQRAMERLKIPTRLACYETETGVQERLKKQVPEANLAGIVYRFLAECVVAVPPSGSHPATTSRLDRLAATAAELQDIAAALDACMAGLSDVGWIINYLGELKLAERDPFEQAQGSFLTSHVRAAVGATDRSFESHWSSRDDDEDSPSLIEATAAKLDEAFKVETDGLSQLDVRALVEQLVLAGDDRPYEPERFLRADLETKLAGELGWEPSRVGAGLDFLLLKPRGSFYSDEVQPSWTKSDVQPWRFNRRLSLNRRPLVLRESKGGPEILFGKRQLWAAWPLQISYLLMSKFKADSDDLRRLLGGIGDERGKQFEDTVAGLYEKFPERFEVLKGRDNFGGKKVQRSPDQDLGDIDVLVAVPSQRELVAIEAKDIAMALTPSELADELATHFQTGDDARRPAAMDRHKERLEWLRQHLEDVLSEFSFDPGETGSWNVDGLFVTDDPVPSAYVIRPELPIISYRELEAALAKPERKPPLRRTSARRN